MPGVSTEPEGLKVPHLDAFFIWNNAKNRHILTIFVDFEGVYAIYTILAEY